MIKSLRLRLTVWYVAFFSLLFLVFSLFLYGVLARSLQARLDQALTSEAEVTAGLLADELEEKQGDTGKASAEAVSEMQLQGTPVAIFEGSRLLAASGTVPAPELAVLAQRTPSNAVISAARRAGSRAPHGPVCDRGLRLARAHRGEPARGA